MDGKARLGIYLHNTYLGNGKFTVTNHDSLTFIERLGLAERNALAVSVLPTPVINPDDYSVVVEQRGITLIPLPGWKNLAESLPSMLFSFGKLLRKARILVENSDIVWMRIPSLVALLFWWVAKTKRKPLIIHVVGNALLAPRRPNYSGLSKVFAYPFSYILHFLTKFMIRYGIMLTAGGELRKLMSSSLYRAYQIDDVLIYKKDIHVPKRKHRYTKILFVGRFDYGKGIEILIDCVEKSRKEFPGINLCLVGDGPLWHNIKKSVSERGLEDCIELPGFVPADGALQKLYSQADIFVLPSVSYEGFPRVILEAWAHGLVVVATRLGGIPYRVKNDYNGLIVSPGNQKELIDVLRRLLLDADICYRLAQGGAQTVRQLTFEHQSSFIRKLLKRYYPDYDIPDAESK